MKFIVVLQPKGWIATARYMYTLAYNIQYDVINKKAQLTQRERATAVHV